MIPKPQIGLTIVLLLAGLFIVVTGINIGFGGMLTLGWQGPTDFFEVVAERAYLVQDSHVRFLGGVWAGIGLLFLISPLDLRRFHPMLRLAMALIFLGGLTRFTMLRSDILFGPEIIASLVAEVILVPILYLWLAKVVRGMGTDFES